MAKKDQAFELFSQGKTLSDPEVLDLGLKKKTLGNYYRAWGKPQAEVVAPAEIVSAPVKIVPVEVQLASLPTATLFELKGERYRIGEKTPECVVCYRLRFFDTGPLPIDKMWRVDMTVSLATFTMVKPIKK